MPEDLHFRAIWKILLQLLAHVIRKLLLGFESIFLHNCSPKAKRQLGFGVFGEHAGLIFAFCEYSVSCSNKGAA